MRFIRFAIALALACLPSALKIPLYRRLYGYQIGRGVRIGLTPFIGVRMCEIGDNARIGSLNFFFSIHNLIIGEQAHIGLFNLFRGGDRLELGAYTTILRLNVFNAIVEGDFSHPVSSELRLGRGVFVGTGHWFDFSDGIHIGDHCIIGGRLSSFWTHNRHRGRPVVIGCHTYIGSEVRVAPGAEIPPFSIVALGSVVVGTLDQSRVLIAGNPARILRHLQTDDLSLVARKTRLDIPDAIAYQLLPDDLRNPPIV